MIPNVISAQDALAQGSRWEQIVSIASFHARTLRALKPQNFKVLPRHKQEAINKQMRACEKMIQAIRSTADAMRRVQEGIGLDG